MQHTASRFTHTSFGLGRREDGSTDDAHRIHERGGSLIAVVADGVGQSREGRSAATRAVDMMVDYYLTRPQAWSPRRALIEFGRTINRAFYRESMARWGSPELLTTLTVAVVDGSMLYGINVGDSPLYLYRQDSLRALHEAHHLDEVGFENALTRALGLEETLQPHAFETKLESGDRIVLCTDGVSSAFELTALGEALRNRPSARSLVTTARARISERGMHLDDATAIIVDVLHLALDSLTPARNIEVLPTLIKGQTIDGYTLCLPLLEDARVWLAEKSDGTRDVLKFFPESAAADESIRDAFLHEIWQATRIDSDYFVKATLPTEGTLRYYSMRFVDAQNLHERLTSGPLKVEDAILLGKFLLSACQFLLTLDQIHGDIKPENVLCETDDRRAIRFRMVDYGSSTDLYSVTSRAGTPSYLAPERFALAPVSERTELYSIGATLYEALSGKLPYGAIERFQTPSFDRVPKALEKLNPAVPAWLSAVVSRAIAVEPERRYQNFSEMLFELSTPSQVRPYYRRDAPLLERNPLRFFQVLSLLLALLNLYLLIYILGH